MKQVIDYSPYSRGQPGGDPVVWPCSWIKKEAGSSPPFVVAFRRQFTVDAAETVRFHVGADERYELYLDGEWIGRGSERGDATHWFFDTYELEMGAGAHVLVAKVWAFGEFAPLAQLSVAPGRFILSPEEDAHLPRIGTGTSEWSVRELEGFSLDQIPYAFGIGWRESIDGSRYDTDYRSGTGAGWEPAQTSAPGCSGNTATEPVLLPSTLPAMLNRRMNLDAPIENVDLPPRSFERASEISLCSILNLQADGAGWENPSAEHPLCIPPHTVRRMVFQLDNYYCAYPEIQLSKGRNARLRVGFSEAAFIEKNPPAQEHYRFPKGARDRIDGKYFIFSGGSTYRCSGKDDALFDPLWWFSGRYVEVLIETQEEPLLIQGISLYETRYPLSMESKLGELDDSWNKMLQMCLRSLQMCSHETYMDCPFYEQLMYVGDTRLEALITYAISADSALPLKAVNMFHASRLPNGLTQACYPYRGIHNIPPFSLWWIAMVNDYALWRGADVINAGILDHMRSIISFFMARKTGKGLVIPSPEQKLGHFNFVDWAEGWVSDWGVPGGDGELNSVFNWQLVYVLKMYAELERSFGQPQLAEQALMEAESLSQSVVDVFWDSEKRLFADDPEHMHFSEHTQSLAILAGTLDETYMKDLALGLERDESLVRVTSYFAHYYFEACVKLGRMDLLERKLSSWFDLLSKGFATVPETPLPTRSDCHAWGAHPLFHYFASILGIRPAEYGFKTVVITPQLGDLPQASGEMVHPNGAIKVDLTRNGDAISGTVNLPEGLTGTLVLPGETRELCAGPNSF